MNTALIAKDLLAGLCLSYQINCLNARVPAGVFRVLLFLYAEHCFSCFSNIQTGAFAVFNIILIRLLLPFSPLIVMVE